MIAIAKKSISIKASTMIKWSRKVMFKVNIINRLTEKDDVIRCYESCCLVCIIFDQK